MILRFLLCLASSLLSGSVVAVLFTAIVQHAFPDAADTSPPPLVSLAANQDVRSVRLPPHPEPATQPTQSEVQPAPPGQSAPAPRVPEVPADPAAHQSPLPVLQSNAQSAGQRYPELTDLTQAAAQDRGQLLAASGAARVLAEGLQGTQGPEAAPDPPTQPDKLAGIARPTTDIATQERDSAGGPISQRSGQDHKPTIAASAIVGDAHIRQAAGGHAMRGRMTTRASHADHAHRRPNRSGDHHAPTQQAQRQTQE